MYFLHKAGLCGEAHASHVLKANELSPRDQDAAILKLYTCSLSINKQKQTNKKRNWLWKIQGWKIDIVIKIHADGSPPGLASPDGGEKKSFFCWLC